MAQHVMSMDEEIKKWQAIESSIQTYTDGMKNQIASLESTVPETVRETVAKGAGDYIKSMSAYRETEQYSGVPQPSVWDESKIQYNRNSDAIAILKKAYTEGRTPLEKEEALQSVIQSLQNAADYFSSQQKTLASQRGADIEISKRERIRLEAQVKELQSVIMELRETAEKHELHLTQSYQTLAQSYDELQQKVQESTKRFWYIKKFREDMSNTIKEAYVSVKNTPQRVKDAIEQTACAVIDDAYTKTAGIFFRVAQSIDQKKEQALGHTRYWKEQGITVSQKEMDTPVIKVRPAVEIPTPEQQQESQRKQPVEPQKEQSVEPQKEQSVEPQREQQGEQQKGPQTAQRDYPPKEPETPYIETRSFRGMGPLEVMQYSQLGETTRMAAQRRMEQQQREQENQKDHEKEIPPKVTHKPIKFRKKKNERNGAER
ncbi:hypothetical protein [Megasphaera massiliensis]|uniref:hypothetical protein n=1 Tax=Megasphaera massiliensis TaxID=1232428 RepID=UPI002598CC08|nr:hypothetical protein [uncultured Megasphaera sp.]